MAASGGSPAEQALLFPLLLLARDFLAGRERADQMDSITSMLENLGEQTHTFLVVEHLVADDELEVKFQALEALSELDRPRTVRAMREILRIFVD